MELFVAKCEDSSSCVCRIWLFSVVCMASSIAIVTIQGDDSKNYLMNKKYTATKPWHYSHTHKKLRFLESSCIFYCRYFSISFGSFAFYWTLITSIVRSVCTANHTCENWVKKNVQILATEDTNKKPKWNNKKKIKPEYLTGEGERCRHRTLKKRKTFLTVLTVRGMIVFFSTFTFRMICFCFSLYFFVRAYFWFVLVNLCSIQFNNNKPFCLALFIQFQLQSCFISVMLSRIHIISQTQKSLQSVMYCENTLYSTLRSFLMLIYLEVFCCCNSRYLLVLFALVKKKWMCRSSKICVLAD